MQLDVDFRLLGLGNPSKGSQKWTAIIDQLTTYISKHAKDSSAKSLIKSLRNKELSTGKHLIYKKTAMSNHIFFSTDTKLPVLLHALCTVLAPVRAAKGFKPTIPLAQEDVLIMAETRELALTKFRNDRAINEPVAPKLIVVGSDLSAATGECMVIYKTIEYTCPKIARGIDVLVKLRMLLGLPYPPTSKLVWMFIEQFVYGVNPVGGGYMVINKLIDYLEPEKK